MEQTKCLPENQSAVAFFFEGKKKAGRPLDVGHRLRRRLLKEIKPPAAKAFFIVIVDYTRTLQSSQRYLRR